ncbi:hypothetical protein NFI96_022219 [Prochilodus magdalenae]|nr:hypothetical protein NFI96_022219 [Prochilodus magdalenae]
MKKSVIVTGLIVAVSFFLVVVNYSEKPYILLQPVLGQSFIRHWMFLRPPSKAFQSHPGYISIPKQEPGQAHVSRSEEVVLLLPAPSSARTCFIFVDCSKCWVRALLVKNVSIKKETRREHSALQHVAFQVSGA